MFLVCNLRETEMGVGEVYKAGRYTGMQKGREIETQTENWKYSQTPI